MLQLKSNSPGRSLESSVTQSGFLPRREKEEGRVCALVGGRAIAGAPER